ncbi:MAG: 6-hydroxynicotinate reductase [Proteobacteria bacterium]|nr:6-hydroxynicotinate reductase [Pseudomonadota bacterium]
MATTHADPAAEVVPEASDTGGGKIVCNACPVLCNITDGRSGACDRYANVAGVLTRVDPLLLMQRPAGDARLVRFSSDSGWNGNPVAPLQADAATVPARREEGDDLFVSGVGSGTTYPDYKPAPFIVSSRHAGVDMVTVVTEGIFSYCSFKIKIDTDRYLGPEQSSIRVDGEVVGHVTTIEYGSQMLSIGGVHHLTGGSKKEGRVTCDVMMALGNKQPVEFDIEGGSKVLVQAGRAPVINGVEEQRMRVGCGSATIGIFATQWKGHVDEVVVVDDHITGVLSEHQAGRFLGMRDGGIKVIGRKSTPGRYFQVANSGSGWGGTDITDPLKIIKTIDPKKAWPGERILFVSTTGEDWAYFILDDNLQPQPAPVPDAIKKVVDRIGENCEPALCTVLFLGGAGGSLRAGVTENPISLTRSIKEALVQVTCGGAPAYIWPGGGIMVMTDVMKMPDASFGWVPTPAIVAPVEFSMKLADYEKLGGHMDRVQTLQQVLATARHKITGWEPSNPWPIV